MVMITVKTPFNELIPYQGGGYDTGYTDLGELIYVVIPKSRIVLLTSGIIR